MRNYTDPFLDAWDADSCKEWPRLVGTKQDNVPRVYGTRNLAQLHLWSNQHCHVWCHFSLSLIFLRLNRSWTTEHFSSFESLSVVFWGWGWGSWSMWGWGSWSTLGCGHSSQACLFRSWRPVSCHPTLRENPCFALMELIGARTAGRGQFFPLGSLLVSGQQPLKRAYRVDRQQPGGSGKAPAPSLWSWCRSARIKVHSLGDSIKKAGH